MRPVPVTPLPVDRPEAADQLRWKLDPHWSSVQVAVRRMAADRLRGHLDALDGALEFRREVRGPAALDLTLAAGSIRTALEPRNAALRGGACLDAARFPTTTFRSRQAVRALDGRLQIPGELTIRGVTRPVLVQALDGGSFRDMWGKERRRLTAITTFDLTEFGFQPHHPIGTDDWLVAGEVEALLHTQWVRGEPREDRLRPDDSANPT
jgi:polyisoprenoid-binding protein YceI